MSSESTLRIGVILPEILGTYGDAGNAVVLRERAVMRAQPAEIVTVPLGEAIPSECDIYVLGGAEDSSQVLAAQALRADSALKRCVESGRPLLAVCAAFQVLGHWFEDASGQRHEGVGLLDVVTLHQPDRAIGELHIRPHLDGVDELVLGFENHSSATFLGSQAAPFGVVEKGHGNALRPAPSDFAAQHYDYPVDGAIQGSIVATYAHGPVLARNPQLADVLLAQAMGAEVSRLSPIELSEVTELRSALLS